MNYAEYYLNPFKTAAASFAVAIAAPAHDISELESIVAAHAREPNGGLIVLPDTFTSAHGKEITSLAARHRLPAVYPFRFFAELGGLLSYGNDRLDGARRATGKRLTGTSMRTRVTVRSKALQSPAAQNSFDDSVEW